MHVLVTCTDDYYPPSPTLRLFFYLFLPRQVALNFGGVYYDISSADFNIGRLTSGSSLCLGGIYGVRPVVLLSSASQKIVSDPGVNLEANLFHVIHLDSSGRPR